MSNVKAWDFGEHCVECCDEEGCGDEKCRQDEGDWDVVDRQWDVGGRDALGETDLGNGDL